MKKITLITSLLICLAPGIIGGMITASAIPTWYMTLTKPSINPPNWIFAPVWTILYILMGLSLYLVRTTKTEAGGKLFFNILFYHQLVLNLLWTVFFFGLKNPKLALIEIGLLDIFVAFTCIAAYRIHKKAGLLLLPYMAWISFATYLNLMIALLNRPQ